MSAQVFVNPDDIRDFARALRDFNRELADATASLHARFIKLGDTWRDQEHDKFAQEFDALVRTLRHFHRSSEDQIPTLIKKADWIDGYLGHR